MPSLNKPHHRNRYPANAILRCVNCTRTGTTARMSGHIARGACKGAELSLVSIIPEELPGPVPAPAPTPGPEPLTSPFVVPEPPPVQPPPPPPDPEGPPGDELDDDDPDNQEHAGEFEDEFPTSSAALAMERPAYREPVAPRGRSATERAAVGAGVSDFWRPVQLTPETHVYYRMACTDPVFAERFGGRFAGSVAAFVDQIVHAFFVLNLRHGLGLAPLEGPEDDDQDPDAEERPLTAREFRDLFAEMMGQPPPEVQRARATANAGAA